MSLITLVGALYCSHSHIEHHPLVHFWHQNHLSAWMWLSVLSFPRSLYSVYRFPLFWNLHLGFLKVLLQKLTSFWALWSHVTFSIARKTLHWRTTKPISTTSCCLAQFLFSKMQKLGQTGFYKNSVWSFCSYKNGSFIGAFKKAKWKAYRQI